jgi:hypothetical protein
MNTEPRHAEVGTVLEDTLSKSPPGLNWTKVCSVCLVGITLGALIPVAMKFSGHWPTQSRQEVQVASQPLERPVRLKKPEKPVMKAPAARGAEARVALQAPAPAAKAVQNISKKTVRKADTSPQQRLAARASTPEVTKTSPAASQVVRTEPRAARPQPLAGTVEKRVPPKATVVVLEEVPTAPSVQQIETLMLRNQKTTSPQLAKPVALPAGAGLGQTAELNQDSEKPLPVLDTGRPSKTYAMVINNASYSKETLNNCPKRCLLLGLDAFGQPIKAIISGPVYAEALLNHNGSINLSGQPRLVKNQQVLLVENVTFNLASNLRSKPPAPAIARPSVRSEGAAVPVHYTPIPTEADDLKPGQVIKNRKQIPIDSESELPEPTTMDDLN